MTDRSLLERWGCMMKITPHESSTNKQLSWSDNTKQLLSTDKKIYAIKVSESGTKPAHFHLTDVAKKKNKLQVKKWLGKCKWGLPKALILFSVIQLFFHFIGPINQAYQILAFSPIRKLELWRFLTYSLLHAGTAHLVINVILQLFIALPLETEVGPLPVVFVYIGGIFSGSLAASVSPDFSLMVGASSGIYSLLMSHVPHIYMNFSSISYRTNRIIVVAVLAISDVIYAAIHCLENREPQIAIRSHVAGALSGILLGFICYESHRSDANRDEVLKFKILKRTSMALYLGFVALIVTINFL